MLTKIQKEIVNFVQGDLAVKDNPYAQIALKLKISEDKVIYEIKKLKKLKVLRRFGAILDHKKIGYRTNCMCVWSVPAPNLGKIVKIIKSTEQISHCYLRRKNRDWPYNFYTMIHCNSQQECINVISDISNKAKVKNYKMLFTLKEFKKISTKYFMASGCK